MRILAGSFSTLAILILGGCGKEGNPTPAPVPVKTETVASQEVRPAWRYSGEIRPDKQVQLAFKEAGYVDGLHQLKGADGRVRDLQVGDEVPAGTVLARLRRSDYDASLSTAVGQQQSVEGRRGPRLWPLASISAIRTWSPPCPEPSSKKMWSGARWFQPAHTHLRSTIRAW